MAGSDDDERFKAAARAISPKAHAEDATDVPTVKLIPMPARSGEPPEARFGERVRESRQQLGLTIEALSRLCRSWDAPDGKGISPPTIGRYEENATLPGLRELRLLADALGVPVQWLVDGNLPRSGGTREIQALAVALREFVEYVQGDIQIGSMTVSETLRQQSANVRETRLTEAKRPPP